MHSFIRIILAALISLSSVFPAFAATPLTMNYQGYLKSSAGGPYNGSKKLIFWIYDVASGGTPLWAEAHLAVNVVKGQFSVNLGSVDPATNPLNLTFNVPYWLGVTVDPETTEMTPRQPLTTVPYAFRAATAESVQTSNRSIVANLNADMLDGRHATYFQPQVSGSCASGSYIRVVNADGTVTCEAVPAQAVGVPAGSSILGTSSTPPTGYTYTGSAFAPIDQNWASKKFSASTTYYSASASVNGKFYVIGGMDGSYVGTTMEYDPVNNSWATKAAMPTPRYFAAAAVANGKIYVIGGYNGTTLNVVEEYDPATNSWATKAVMPTPRYAHGAAAVGGKIYVIGGVNKESVNEEYNPATNSWSTKASPLFAVKSAVVASSGTYVYVFDWDRTLQYYPSGNSWSTLVGMSVARGSACAAEVNGKVYVMGGINRADQSTKLAVVEEFNPVNGGWISRSNMLAVHDNCTAASVNGQVYFYGLAVPPASNLEEYTPPAAVQTLYYIHKKN